MELSCFKDIIYDSGIEKLIIEYTEGCNPTGIQLSFKLVTEHEYNALYSGPGNKRP